MTNYNLVVGGASCTADSPWKTWSDLVEERYGIKSTSVGKKGLGNVAIITKTLAMALRTKNPIVAVMLTSVDKWDWYTQDRNILKKLTKEKHNGSPIANEKDGAYWSTGSHFPLWKDFYYQNYFSLRQMTLDTIKHIDLLVKTCKSKQWPFVVGTDYSIFSYTEKQCMEDYETVKKNKLTHMISYPVKVFFDEIKDYVDLNGLLKIGYDKGLPVFHSKYGPHPGTAVHYEYCKFRYFPFFDKYFAVANPIIQSTIEREQQLWIDSNL